MSKTDSKPRPNLKRWITVIISGTVLGICIILATLEVSRRDIVPFITTQQKYLITIEAALFAVFLVEMLARIISYSSYRTEVANYGIRLRLILRVVGYLIAAVSVVSILASNPTLAISVGAVVGVVIAFATQNMVGNMLATILLVNTNIVRVGEEVTVTGIKGTIIDINTTHTVLSVDGDVIFVPNSVMMSTAVRRKERANQSR